MLTLNLPYNGINIQDLKKNVKLGKYKNIPDGFSPDFQIIIDKLLANDFNE